MADLLSFADDLPVETVADGVALIEEGRSPTGCSCWRPARWCSSATVCRSRGSSRLDGLTHYLVDVKQQFSDAGGHLEMVDQILDTLVHHQGPAARTGSARDPAGDHDHG